MIMLLIISLFGLVHSPMVVFLPLVIILECFLFSAMGMTAMAISPSYEFFNYYFTLLISPMFFLSGVFFPLTRFPGWVQKLAWFSPLNHAVNASRGLVLGSSGPVIILDMLWMAAFGVLFFFVAANRVHRRLIK
jgi:lipooligosaccharide transport system permease protein